MESEETSSAGIYLQTIEQIIKFSIIPFTSYVVNPLDVMNKTYELKIFDKSLHCYIKFIKYFNTISTLLSFFAKIYII